MRSSTPSPQPFIHSALLGVCLFGCTSVRSAMAETHDWPQWQGPTRDAVSTETGLLQQWPEAGPPLAWRIDGLGGGYGAPAVADGRIFGISKRDDEEVVWALSEKDGGEIWSTTIGKAPEGGMRQGIEGAGCTPTVDGERLYILGFGGDLACLTASDGKIVWKRNLIQDFGGHLPTWRYNESPLIDGDKLICTPGGNEATLIALNKNSGEVIWKNVLPGHTDDTQAPEMMASLPLLVALDKNTDKEIELSEMETAATVLAGLDKNGDGKLEESEVRAEGGGADNRRENRRRRRGGGMMRSMKVLAGLDANENGEIEHAEIKSSVAALKKLDENGDGKLVESEVGQRFAAPRRSGAGYSSAMVFEFGGVRQYVQFTSKALVGVAAADGKPLWSYDKPANRNGINCSSPIYSDGRIFAASAYGTGGGLARLTKRDDGSFSAEEIWFTKDMENQHGGMIVIDDCLYGANGGNGGGYLACIDFKTGELLWNDKDRDGDRVEKGSMAYGDGRIYYLTEDGTALLIEPNRESYLERGRFGLPDRTRHPAWSHPVIANGKLYLRDQDHLFCYDVKQGGSGE